jgi:nicotinamidase-related amidase
MKPNVPDHSAVLVIDVQRGLFCTEPAPYEAEAVVGRINVATAKARKAGSPVIFIQHDGVPGGEDVVPGTEGWKLHPKLEVRSGDPVIRKTMGDAFYGSTLEAELRSRGITTVLLMGYATDFCVDATLRSATSKDFSVIVVADAHTTSDNPVLKAAVVREHHNWAWANAITKKGVTVLKADEVRFPTGAMGGQASSRAPSGSGR